MYCFKSLNQGSARLGSFDLALRCTVIGNGADVNEYGVRFVSLISILHRPITHRVVKGIWNVNLLKKILSM
jgi:hypothetical protein